MYFATLLAISVGCYVVCFLVTIFMLSGKSRVALLLWTLAGLCFQLGATNHDATVSVRGKILKYLFLPSLEAWLIQCNRIYLHDGSRRDCHTGYLANRIRPRCCKVFHFVPSLVAVVFLRLTATDTNLQPFL